MTDLDRALVNSTAHAIAECVSLDVAQDKQPLAEAMQQEFRVHLTNPELPVQTRSAIAHRAGRIILRNPAFT